MHTTLEWLLTSVGVWICYFYSSNFSFRQILVKIWWVNCGRWFTRDRNCLPFVIIWVHYCFFNGVRVAHLFSFLYCFFALFIFVLCFAYLMLAGYLDFPFLITPLVFSIIYLHMLMEKVNMRFGQVSYNVISGDIT